MHTEPAPQDALRPALPVEGSCPAASETEAAAVCLSFTDLALPGPAEVAAHGRAEASAGAYILRQFEQLADANEALQRELSRCYERLNIVLEISEHASGFEDPAAIESALLSRYGSTLDAAALLLDRESCCAQVWVGQTGNSPLTIAPSRLRTRLASEIDTVRRTRRPRRLTLSDATDHRQTHVLLAALHEAAELPHVVIAVRGGQQPPFSADDQLASETVLTYGGHILRNALMVRRLQQASLETVGALANAIEARDNYTGGHSERVGALAVMTGKSLDLTASDLQMLEWAGLLHDVGKIGIPEHILNKPGELTAEEFEQIKQHPRLGYNVLRPVSTLKPLLDAVLYHHENHDGSGYPEGLSAQRIPLSARILHVVDIFDALTSTRAYRQRLDVDQALKLLAEGARRVTDPAITTAFLRAFDAFRRTDPDEFRRRFAHL